MKKVVFLFTFAVFFSNCKPIAEPYLRKSFLENQIQLAESGQQAVMTLSDLKVNLKSVNALINDFKPKCPPPPDPCPDETNPNCGIFVSKRIAVMDENVQLTIPEISNKFSLKKYTPSAAKCEIASYKANVPVNTKIAIKFKNIVNGEWVEYFALRKKKGGFFNK